MLALSQSGRTPDVIEYVTRARREGAFALAVTNDTDSELALAADLALPLAAGPERSVAATKTYSNQVAALALFAAHAAGRGDEIADGIRATADLLERRCRRSRRRRGRSRCRSRPSGGCSRSAAGSSSRPPARSR